MGLPGGPYYFPGHAFGDVGLEPEKLKAYEVAYLGTYSNGLIVNLAAYRNETKNSIDFFVKSIYGFGRVPPPQVGLPPTLQFCFTGFDPCGIILGPAQAQIPAEFSYRNVGKTVDRGVELSLQRRRAPWSWYINGSWQDKPEFDGLTPREEATQNLPPTWRANGGFGYDPGRWFFNVSANYSDEAFWADVLNVTGTTDAYTLLNADLGFRFNQHTTFSVIGSNVTDERVQQHIFGDIMQRKVTGQVVFNF